MPFRFVHWILSLALVIGVGSALADLTLKMARAAAHAHQYDRMSYAKFTRALVFAKPRAKPKKQNTPNDESSSNYNKKQSN